MTTVCSNSKKKVGKPEFLFNGAGVISRLKEKPDPPNGSKIQWAPKGSYRVEHVLKYIENLPTLPVTLTPGRMEIFTLDDYSAHLEPSVKGALFKKGYIPVIIGGGITGDVQVNDADYHHPVKGIYCEKEEKLMLEMLIDRWKSHKKG